jgi:hypothetical protein
MKTSHFFGPSRNEVWKKVSEQIQAEYVKDNFWSGAKIIARHESWLITLDSFLIPMGKIFIPMTRLRAPFRSMHDFRFQVYNQGFLDNIGKFFGMQDIETGAEEFDRRFVLKGNAPEKVQKLFSEPEIQRMMLEDRQLRLEIRDDEGWFGQKFPAETDELYFQTTGEIRDEERLKNLFQLFSAVLTELEKMGEASPADPGIILK